MKLKTCLSFFAMFFVLTSFVVKADITPHTYYQTRANMMPVTGTDIPAMRPFDQKFVRFMRLWRMPGGSVTVMKNNGEIVFTRGYGWSHVGRQQVMEPDALFRIASVSKTFTAVTILKLVQEHRLRLDDKVFLILNDLQPIDGRKINPRIYNITVLNLLQMSSGWLSQGHGGFDQMFGPWPRYFSSYLGEVLPASCEDTTRLMMTMPLHYKPGTMFSYSNLNYCILGLIIDKVTQQPYGHEGYENYIRNQILLPLGIERMQIGSTSIHKVAPGEVHYYSYPTPPEVLAKLQWENYLPYAESEILQKDFGAAGWIASSQDLAKFVYALSQHRIISTSMLWTMMQRPGFVDRKRKAYYTMGMKLDDINNQKYWIMTGSFNGTNAYIIRKPNGTIITVIFNSRAPTYALFSRFRPQLNRLLLNNVVF